MSNDKKLTEFFNSEPSADNKRRDELAACKEEIEHWRAKYGQQVDLVCDWSARALKAEGEAVRLKAISDKHIDVAYSRAEFETEAVKRAEKAEAEVLEACSARDQWRAAQIKCDQLLAENAAFRDAIRACLGWFALTNNEDDKKKWPKYVSLCERVLAKWPKREGEK